MIVGVGVDAVDLARFERAIAKTPRLIERLFTTDERIGSARTLAGRFAAKEAFIKAVGDPRGMNWQEVSVDKDALGKPGLSVSGATAKITDAAGIDKFHLSITHDGGMAIAFVVAEGQEGGDK
jgi:holo-[acyl-carrier protein] synthase